MSNRSANTIPDVQANSFVIEQRNSGLHKCLSFFSRRALILAVLGAGVSVSGCAVHDGPHPGSEPPQIRSEVARLQPVLAQSNFGTEMAKAVISHPALREGLADVAGAEANLANAQSIGRPRMGVGLNLASGFLGAASNSSVLPVLNVSQLLFDGGATRARVDAAKVGVVSAILSRETEAAQITLNAVQIWYDLWLQRRLMSIMTDNLSTHAHFVALIEERVEAGAGTEIDLITVNSRLSSATAQITEIRANLDRAEASYIEIFGDLPSTLVVPELAPSLPNVSDDELIRTSPRLRGLDAQIAGAQAALEATKASKWPSLTLGVAVSYDPATEATTGEATASPSLGIINGGQRAAAIAGAQADLDRLVAEREGLERQIARTLSFLRSDARTGQDLLRTSRAAVDASQSVVDASQEQFLIGRMSILQLLDAQRDLAQAKQSLVLAERDLGLSGYSALALTGDILDVFGILLPIVGPNTDQLPRLANVQHFEEDLPNE